MNRDLDTHGARLDRGTLAGDGTLQRLQPVEQLVRRRRLHERCVDLAQPAGGLRQGGAAGGLVRPQPGRRDERGKAGEARQGGFVVSFHRALRIRGGAGLAQATGRRRLLLREPVEICACRGEQGAVGIDAARPFGPLALPTACLLQRSLACLQHRLLQREPIPRGAGGGEFGLGGGKPRLILADRLRVGSLGALAAKLPETLDLGLHRGELSLRLADRSRKHRALVQRLREGPAGFRLAGALGDELADVAPELAEEQPRAFAPDQRADLRLHGGRQRTRRRARKRRLLEGFSLADPEQSELGLIHGATGARRHAQHLPQSLVRFLVGGDLTAALPEGGAPLLQEALLDLVGLAAMLEAEAHDDRKRQALARKIAQILRVAGMALEQAGAQRFEQGRFARLVRFAKYVHAVAEACDGDPPVEATGAGDGEGQDLHAAPPLRPAALR